MTESRTPRQAISVELAEQRDKKRRAVELVRSTRGRSKEVSAELARQRASRQTALLYVREFRGTRHATSETLAAQRADRQITIQPAVARHFLRSLPSTIAQEMAPSAQTVAMFRWPQSRKT